MKLVFFTIFRWTINCQFCLLLFPISFLNLIESVNEHGQHQVQNIINAELNWIIINKIIQQLINIIKIIFSTLKPKVECSRSTQTLDYRPKPGCSPSTSTPLRWSPEQLWSRRRRCYRTSWLQSKTPWYKIRLCFATARGLADFRKFTYLKE